MLRHESLQFISNQFTPNKLLSHEEQHKGVVSMIEKPTIFVLGAGASMHLGYPSTVL